MITSILWDNSLVAKVVTRPNNHQRTTGARLTFQVHLQTAKVSGITLLLWATHVNKY